MHNNSKELAALISIRNFLIGAMENFNYQLTKEKYKEVQEKISALNTTILERSLKLDLSEKDHYAAETKTFTSTIDVDELMAAVVKKEKGKKKPSKTNENKQQ